MPAKERRQSGCRKAFWIPIALAVLFSTSGAVPVFGASGVWKTAARPTLRRGAPARATGRPKTARRNPGSKRPARVPTASSASCKPYAVMERKARKHVACPSAPSQPSVGTATPSAAEIRLEDLTAWGSAPAATGQEVS